MAELRVEEERRGARVALAPSHWLDISNVSGLVERVQAAAGGGGAVLLDFAGTEYIDSAAISGLIQCQKFCEDAGVEFGLTGLADQVERVLQETRLIDIFRTYPDRDAFWAGAGDGAA